MLSIKRQEIKLLWENVTIFYRMKVQKGTSGVRCAHHEIVIDPAASLALKTTTYRKHPGKLQPKLVRLPEKLQDNVPSIFKERRVGDLESQVSVLTNYLWSRRRPVEAEEVRAAAQYFNKQLGGTDDEETDPDEQKRLQNKVKSKLRSHLYHWKPITYDENMSLVYLAARMAPNYAVIYRVLQEIQRRIPGYKPTSVLDFGSGLGSSVWATDAVFPESVKEYYCLDISQAMHKLAGKLLLKPGCTGQEPTDFIISGVYQRFFLPVSPEVKYDITISNHSLLEIKSHEERLKIVNILWKKTNDFLILIENGSLEGYFSLMEVRNMILAKGQEEEEKECDVGHVFAPCAHDGICQRLTRDKMRPCNFEQSYEPLDVPGMKKKLKGLERFSYLVMRKGRRKEGTVWPRVVDPVLLRSRHVICRICHRDGQLKELIITKGKHERDLYRCTRYTTWGDMLPVSDIREIPNTSKRRRSGTMDQEERPTKNEESERRSDAGE